MTVSPALKSHILVVDDEPEMCNICARALQARGYQVTTIQDATQAPALISQGAYDLLLTDLKMPGISGLDLALMARQRDPTAAVVMMTAFASYDHLHQAMQNGISEFLPKPFDLSQLILAVTDALHRRDVIRDNVRLRALEALRIDSEILTSTLDYALLVQYILNLAVRWSEWQVAALLVGDEKTPLTSVTVVDQQWHVAVAGMELAHRVLKSRQATTMQGDTFTHSRYAICTTMALPLAWGTFQGVLMIGTVETHPNVPTVSELMTLLVNQSVAALRNAETYGAMSNLYHRQRQIEMMKDEFIAIASHELRTPLTMVVGYADMLNRTLQGVNQNYAAEIHANAMRMSDVVERMAQLQKTNLDTQLIVSEFQIAPLVAQVVQQIADRFPLLRVHTHIDEAPLPMRGDMQWMRVILAQLIGNAATHAQHDVINVHVHYEYPIFAPTPQPTDPRQWMTITVSDLGVGIDMREQLHVFGSFVQLDHSLTRAHGGAGLGLTLVYDMVQRLGGFVMMSSKVGVGSTFVVMIPTIPVPA
jgi:signal transduction histidine kinase